MEYLGDLVKTMDDIIWMDDIDGCTYPTINIPTLNYIFTFPEISPIP
jgi:hypothetical protein